MDSIGSVAGRIAEIQGRLSALAPAAPSTPLAVGPPSSVGTSASGGAGSFQDVLTREVTRSGRTTRTTPSGTSGVGSGRSLVDGKGVPVELKRYGNGKVPSSALSRLDGSNHMLWRPAARSAEAMIKAAKRDGVTIGITDSYRDYATQVRLAEEKGLYNQGGLAAVPGTSMHGWGVALDLRLDGRAQAWMRKHGDEFGFVENVPREPWHWQYVPTR